MHIILLFQDLMARQYYKRGWKHGKSRGKEGNVTCGFCGRQVPKYKTFPVFRGFRINDPQLTRELGRDLSFMSQKIQACPSCARHRKIVEHSIRKTPQQEASYSPSGSRGRHNDR